MKDVCRDGAFCVIFYGSPENLYGMKFLLGSSNEDGLVELLGGGFDLSDVTPYNAVVREIKEETNGFFPSGKFNYFCHMTQKVPLLGDGERGNLFCFYKEIKEIPTEDIKPSPEHSEIRWHTLLEILTNGEKVYRTSSLRLIIHLLKYLKSGKDFIFGILADKVNFYGYRF